MSSFIALGCLVVRVKGYYAGGLPIFAWTAYETNTGSFTHQLSGIHNFANTGASKKYKPMNFLVRGQYEVAVIRKLLDTLPPVGCAYCSLAEPAKVLGADPSCVCNHLFLTQRSVLKWRSTDKVWFARSKWSDERLQNLTATVCKEAGTKKAYSNGSIRPTNLTSMAMTGLTPGQMTESFQLQTTYNE